MTLWITLALAHPVTAGGPGRPVDFVGQRLDVELGDGRVGLSYLLEVPVRRVTADAGDAGRDYAEARLDELADGLKVRWDGEPLAVERRPVARAARLGEQGFVEFELRLEGALPADAGTLTVENRNLPTDDAFFATYVRVDGDLVVEASSLAAVRDGRLRDNTHGAWTRDEAARELMVAVRPAGPWERRDTPGALPERLAGLDALGPPAWLYPAAGATGLALLAGLAWMRRRRR